MKRFLFSIALSCHLAFAGTTGKIAGRIVDAGTEEPLPSAIIQIVGTTLGASTDSDGNYFIINVPVGTYTLRASLLGYRPKSVSQCDVQIDFTTTLDFSLAASDIQVSDVIIVATRPPIQVDLTSTKHTIDADAISSLPVDDFREIVGLQAGVVGSHFRGGRFNEALFMVDGMQLKSAVNGYTGYTAGFAINVPQISIAEIQVTTGGFEAEYGNAQSGIVNALTRDGGEQFSGRVRVRTSDFPWSRMEWRPNAYGTGQPDWKNYEGFVSSPSFATPIGKISLVASTDISLQNRGFLTHEKFYHESYQGKINIASGTTRIVVSGLTSYSLDNTYYHTYSKYGPLSQGYQSDLYQEIKGSTLTNYRFVPDPQHYPSPVSVAESGTFNGVPYTSMKNIYQPGMQDRISLPVNNSSNLGFSVSQTLNANSFLDMKLSFFNSRVHQVVRDAGDRNRNGSTVDALSWLDNGDTTGTTGYATRYTAEGYWYYAGDEGLWFDQTTSTLSGRIDYSNQITTSHMLKAGVEFNYNKGEVNKVTFESVQNLRFDVWNEDLIDIAAYVQDKIEVRDGFIVNAGLRLDYYDPNGLSGDVLYPADPLTLPYFKNGAGLTGSDKVSARYQVSPRIGISHPISERDKLHFYYGHFFQRPDFRYLYENISLNFRYASNVDLGNPRLLPEKTVSYEVGWEHLFSDYLLLSFTGYFKDITNLVGAVDYVISGSPDSYQAFTNMDYANVRGIEISLSTTGIQSFGGMFNYTYAFANGRSSSVFRDNGEIVPRRLDPLEWDVRHKVNTNIQIRSTGWADEYVGEAELDFVITVESGMPYTRNTRDVFPLFALRNDGRLPATKNVDMRVRKSFDVKGVSLSLLGEVRNLFDWRNVEFIAGGRDGIALFEATEDPTGPYHDPSALSSPRMYRLGIEINF